MSVGQEFSSEELDLAFDFVVECSDYFASSVERKRAMSTMREAVDSDILKAVILDLMPSEKITPDGLVGSKLQCPRSKPSGAFTRSAMRLARAEAIPSNPKLGAAI